jgi:hypothetical protein
MEHILIPILIAVVICFTPKIKYAAQMMNTITHELGHAVVVMPFGGKLQGIKLRLTTEGEAVVSIPSYPFPFYHLLRIVNLFAGYSAPLYLSLAFYVILTQQWYLALTIIFAIMSILTLFFIRNLFGLVVALFFLGLNALFIFVVPEFVDEYALTFAVILLIRGLTDIYNAARWTFKHRLESSDFVIASKELHGSPELWFVLFSVFHAALLTTLIWLLVTYL